MLVPNRALWLCIDETVVFGAKAVHLNTTGPHVGASSPALAQSCADPHPVGTAAGCDLLILFLRIKSKRSQPAAAPTEDVCDRFVGSEEAQERGDNGFRGVFLDEVAGVGDWVEL